MGYLLDIYPTYFSTKAIVPSRGREGGGRVIEVRGTQVKFILGTAKKCTQQLCCSCNERLSICFLTVCAKLLPSAQLYIITASYHFDYVDVKTPEHMWKPLCTRCVFLDLVAPVQLMSGVRVCFDLAAFQTGFRFTRVPPP